MEHLAHSIASATLQPASLLSLSPYAKGASDDTHLYGIINARKENPDGLPTHQSCLVHIGKELVNDMKGLYIPGGCSVHFIQQANLNWLVSFDANDILSSAYIRMTNDDVKKLISDGLGGKEN